MKRTFTIDGTPETHIIDSLLHTKVHYPEALGELIDNSLDQAATEVDVFLDGESVVVSDNGNGCANLPSMLRLGSHSRTKDTRLGRYGVGLKNVAMGLGELLEIATRQNGIERRARVDWAALRDSGSWNNIQGEEEETTKPNGTEITISQLRTPVFQLASINNRLSFMFAPALWAGKRISLHTGRQPIRVDPWTIPTMAEPIEFEDVHTSGVGFRLRAGIVENNSEAPFILSYEHRIIGGTSEPLGRYSSMNRFLGFVELFGNWPLLKHKNGIQTSDVGRWLHETIHDVCEPLLEKIQQEGNSVVLDEIAAELEVTLGELFGKAKRPNSGSKKGGIDEKGTHRTVKQAETVEPNNGIVFQRDSDNPRKRKKHGISFIYARFAEDDYRIGKVDVNEKRVEIQLNENHKLVNLCKQGNDRRLLKQIALVLFCENEADSAGTRQMLFQFDKNQDKCSKFVEVYSKLSAQIGAEGIKVLEAA